MAAVNSFSYTRTSALLPAPKIYQIFIFSSLKSFSYTGISAVNMSQDVLVGRSYGGNAIVYWKDFATSISHSWE